MKIIHKSLASGRWHKMSLSEQLANIGSEFNRALHWKDKNDKESEEKSFDRLLELIDLTISDRRWKNRISEILRLREVICDFFMNQNSYNTNPAVLENYFLLFALRLSKLK